MTARVKNPYAEGRGPKPRTAQEHIDANSRREGECLIWTGSLTKDGYGKAWFEGRSVRASRLAFFAATGEWPKHWALHTCDMPLCVEAKHIYDGTPKQNQKDRAERTGWKGVGRKVQTHCSKGHKYTGKKNSRGHNICEQCQNGEQQ